MVTISLSILSAEELRYQIAHYDDNKSPVIVIISSVFFAVALILVVLRFITKVVRKLSYHASDYFIIVAMVLTTGLWIEALLCKYSSIVSPTALTQTGAKWGAGKHTFRVYLEHGGADGLSQGILQVLFALMVTYSCVHLAIKLSILFFYRQIFALFINWFRWAWYFTVSYVVTTWIVTMALALNHCRPISYLWNEIKGMPGECGDLKAIGLGTGIILAFADLLLLVLPLPILASLRRPVKERVLLCGLFALGSLTLVGSIARVVYITRVVSAVDFTYIEVDSLIWSVIEVDLGVICACIPMLRPLFTRRQPSHSGSDQSSRRGNSEDEHSKSRTVTANGSSRSLDADSLTKLEDQV